MERARKGSLKMLDKRMSRGLSSDSSGHSYRISSPALDLED
jgi:hypothetical protein